ncbi:MAG TPA: DUF126 domain-containing protein [Nitrososphaeria archaeon]|nr:MAG: hypothetical protein DRN68_00780 [Nitrososphaerota archaeon]HDJ66421.1 DUF126 domain-containing protein [Nitrososphaeria archaeon]
MIVLKGRAIWSGWARGEALVSNQPISFYGGVDPETGKIIEKGHELEGRSLAGKILVFPYGKGSTVGSYIILRLKKRGIAPKAMVNIRCEPIIAVGAIIAEIPTIDRIEVSIIKDGDLLEVDGATLKIYR